MDWARVVRQSVIGMVLLTMCAACGTLSGPLPISSGSDISSVEDYHLGPGDRLRINVYDEDELTGEYVVGNAGMISFPLVGDQSASGKTLAQFTDDLRTALMRYVLHPNISVEVLNYRPFFILGEVENAGTYPYSPGLNVVNAVATAGGFGYRADTRRVFIKHPDELAERAYPLTSTTPVLPGDTVRIPERRF